MDFSLFYFASDAAVSGAERYRLLLEGARFADAHDFTAIWMPERHFHPFGGIFPNPSVAAAALASATQRVRLRAGSVVLPLHHPARVAEEWAMVDNLSGGRADISFARGWSHGDRILAGAADGMEDIAAFYKAIEQVRDLWRGRSVDFGAASGPTRIFPTPLQPELECWVTCAQNPERFVEAGARGFNILTSLILLPPDRLGDYLARYREARARAGFDPGGGKVTLMLHSLLGENEEAVRQLVSRPFRAYLESSFASWAGSSAKLAAMNEAERARLIDYSMERYYRTSALFGTVETCRPLVEKVRELGVSEIACLIDFGVAHEEALASLPHLDRLRQAAMVETARDTIPAGKGQDRDELLRALLEARASGKRPAPMQPPSRVSDIAGIETAGSAETRGLLVKELRKALREKAGALNERHPASQGQQALWLLQQANPESAAYNTALSLKILAPVDEGALLRASQILVDRHAILRTTYEATPSGLDQVVHGHRALAIEVIDATGWEEERLQAEMRQAYSRPYDLGEATIRLHLFRLGGGALAFMLCVHHIARDGVSMIVLIDDLLACYATECEGREPQLAPITHSFADHARQERERLASPEGQRLRDLWRAALADAPTVIEIPGDRPRPARLGSGGGTVSRTLGAAEVERLRALARQAGATANSLLFTVYAMLLARYSGSDDLLIAMPALGRTGEEFTQVVGYFVNPVPCRARLREGERLVDLAGRMQREIARALAGQELPLPELVRMLDPPRDASRLPLVQMLFGYLRLGADRPLDLMLLPGAEPGRVEIGGLTVEPMLVEQEEGQFDLSMEAIERPASLHIGLKYNAEAFDRTMAARMLDHYVNLLLGVLADPEGLVENFDLLTGPDRAALEEEHVCGALAIPDVSLEVLLRERMARWPDGLAVRDTKRALTFAELGDEIDRLAGVLRAAGAGGTRIGIHAEPSVDALVGILATLAAGAAFVPLDPSYPVARLAFMVADSGAKIVLTDRPVPADMPDDLHVIAIKEATSETPPAEGVHELSYESPDRRPAYVLYTSGSSGRPKGVTVAHRSVVNLLLDMERRIPLGPDDVLYSITALSFDIVIVELLLPLITGATLEFAGPVARDPDRLSARLEAGGVRMMQATPTMWRLIVASGWSGTPSLIAVTAGEALPEPLALALRERCEVLWNGYGPTESTVYTTALRVTEATAPGSIGRPLANVEARVVDERLRELPPGLPGELLVGGAGVALGYHGQPELTDARFVVDPRAPESGLRLYRTGDRVRRQEDGDLVYLGRIDHQLKLNGVRVEPGEIEAVFEAHPAVAGAVVVPEMEDGRVRHLVGWWTARDPGKAPEPAALRRYLAEHLPTTMVPARLEQLEQFPQTPSGKVDRLALAARDSTCGAAARRAPASTTELSGLGALWCDVLAVECVAPEDNFFDLGGASLDAIQFVARARAAGHEIEIADVFQYPTLAALECALAERAPGPLNEAVGESDSALPEDLIRRQSRPAASARAPVTAGRCRARIESMGVYLPEGRWRTADVVAGCRTPLALDLEKLTGIVERPRAGEGEFAIDLAAQAVERCLARSGWRRKDVELVICCNISRYDEESRISFEPATAARLCERLGLATARAFDVNNACAGMFTGIRIADIFFRTGRAANALIISGEHITHLTETAQREIQNVLDPRMACLTLGDSGVALMLEPSSDGLTGFQELDLFTLPAHSELCIARPSEQAEGGAIMLTDSLALSDVATRAGLRRALRLLDREGLTGHVFDRFIMHQTSSTTIRNGRRELERMLGGGICTEANTVDNLAGRGNTSSTTHFVALADEIARGNIAPGQRLMFNISASGVTLGTAFYAMDDLPTRMAQTGPATSARNPATVDRRPGAGAAITGLASLPADHPALADTLTALEAVSRQCLDAAGRSPQAIDLVLFCGIHRTDFICEPATATRLARVLAMDTQDDLERQVFAFDVLNGGAGFLDAFQIGAQWIAAGEARTVLVATAEIDPNDPLAGHPASGVLPGAGAVLLEADGGEGLRFAALDFLLAEGASDKATAYCTWDKRGAHVVVDRDAGWEDLLASTCADLALRVLAAEDLSLADLDFIVAPRPSPEFAARLAGQLGLPVDRIVELPSGALPGDMLTCALPAGLVEAEARGLARPNAVGLLLAGGAGVTAGCAVLRC